MKSIVKQVLIILLSCIAICLVLCIIFYNYMPINIVIPSTVEAYTTSDAIKNEINENVTEYPKQNIVFEITNSDLTMYKQSQSYNPGKSDPFAADVEDNTNTTASTNSAGQTTGTTNSASQGGQSQTTPQGTTPSDNSTQTSTTNTQANSNGTFFQDTQLK